MKQQIDAITGAVEALEKRLSKLEASDQAGRAPFAKAQSPQSRIEQLEAELAALRSSINPEEGAVGFAERLERGALHPGLPKH